MRLLIIDDSPAIHEDFAKIIRVPPGATLDDSSAALFGETAAATTQREFELEHANQGQAGVAAVERSLAEGRPFAVAFVDMRMPPGWNGIETIERLWKIDPHVQIVICTAYSEHSWQELVGGFGDTDCLFIVKKPFDAMEVLQLAHALSRKWQNARETSAKLQRLGV